MPTGEKTIHSLKASHLAAAAEKAKATLAKEAATAEEADAAAAKEAATGEEAAKQAADKAKEAEEKRKKAEKAEKEAEAEAETQKILYSKSQPGKVENFKIDCDNIILYLIEKLHKKMNALKKKDSAESEELLDNCANLTTWLDNYTEYGLKDEMPENMKGHFSLNPQKGGADATEDNVVEQFNYFEDKSPIKQIDELEKLINTYDEKKAKEEKEYEDIKNELMDKGGLEKTADQDDIDKAVAEYRRKKKEHKEKWFSGLRGSRSKTDAEIVILLKESGDLERDADKAAIDKAVAKYKQEQEFTRRLTKYDKRLRG